MNIIHSYNYIKSQQKNKSQILVLQRAKENIKYPEKAARLSPKEASFTKQVKPGIFNVKSQKEKPEFIFSIYMSEFPRYVCNVVGQYNSTNIFPYPYPYTSLIL